LMRPTGADSIANVSAQPAELVVDLPLYSGPFRLLANLILDQKMDVCDVPVARITDEFVRRGLARVEGWTLEESTWFLATCAALLELKVVRLLPRPVASEEEDLLGGASPDLLYARTIELAAFRRVAEWLAEAMAEASLMVPRNIAPPSEFSHLYPDFMEKVSPEALAGEAARLLAPAPDLDLSHVTPIRASLAEALAAVQSRLAARPQSRFRDLLDDSPERIEVVVRFLALLELYREGKVELRQAGVFGDIEVRWQGSVEGVSLTEVEAK
jgi:segregation and condensation protein A